MSSRNVFSNVRPASNFCRKQHPIYDWTELEHKIATLKCFPTVTMDIFRHGQSVTNFRGLVTGSQNVELTDLGVKQAENLALSIKPYYDTIYTSSLKRSVHTLGTVLSKRRVQIGQACCDPRLDERSLGSLEGEKQRHIREFELGELRYAPPGGESYLQVTQRILSFLVDLFLGSKQLGRSLTVLVSTHMGPLRIIIGTLEKIPSAARVLSMNFDNATVMSISTNHLEFPAFFTFCFIFY